MKKVNTFQCKVRPLENGFDNIQDRYELVCEHTRGKDVVLFAGNYVDCRKAMDDYFQRLITVPERNVVQWHSELSFVVHEIVEDDNAMIGAY